MDATQLICDSHLESDEEESEEESGNSRGHPLGKLRILKNEHIPEAEFPLFLGDNVLGREPSTCTLPLLAPSVSKQHATISLSVYRTRGHQSEVEALVWDHGSLNGTRKGRLKLTSNVRYALSEGDSLVLADIPCQYVTCAADTLSSQRDLRTPVSRNSGVKNRLPDALRENRSDSGIVGEKSVNGSTKARVPLPDLEDTRRTPAKTSCLSFEQTPIQPQGTLVPDSDSDSDGERRTGGDTKRKILVSDSGYYKSSPTCSTFLSPTNKIVPESEDESSITPPSSTKNRPCRHVSFSTEETDMNVARQQLQEKKSLVIMGDSEEEEGSKEERATSGTKPDKSGQLMPGNQESSASLAVGDKLPVVTPALSTDVIAPFNMDSDTDVEEEEERVERVAVTSVTLNTNKQDDQPPTTVQFNMDSDTDVDEDSDALVSGPKSVLLSDDATKPPVHVIRPQGISMDSDTDVDDDDNVSKAAKTATSTSSQAAHTANSALVTQPEDFQLDSDTDVDEDEEKECGTNVICSTTSKTSAGLDLVKTGPESTPVAPHSWHLDSDTDDEEIPGPILSERLVGSDVTHTVEGADLEVLTNCYTDTGNESSLVIPVAITTLSGTSAAANESDSDADTDVDESSMPPAGNENIPADLKLNSDMDVEDKVGHQIPDLCREQTSLLPVLLQQKCSTPVQQSDPSPGRPAAFSLSSDSQEEEDFVVAETQAFILQHRDRQKCSTDDPTKTSGLESSVNKKDGSSSTGRTFQLELSDSSHLQCQAQALAMDSTQPFSVTEDGAVQFEETQLYADIMTADQTSGENKSYLEATQAYGGEDGCSIGTEKELHADLALQATQAYIPEPYSDAEEETEGETQPSDPTTSATLAMAETQLMPVLGIEHSPTQDDRLSSVPQFATKEKVEQGEGAPREQRQSEVLSIAETQPMSISNYEESEDSFPVLRKRKAKQLKPEEETQTSVNSDLSIAETQPMCITNYAQSDDEDSLPILRKRKAKQLKPEEDETQTSVNSDLSVAETQPMCISEESDDEDSFPGPRKRKAKPLEHKDEDTQSLTNSGVSAIQALPVETKPCVQLQEEQVIQYEAGVSGVNKEDTHRVGNPVAETQPMCSSNFEESDGEDSMPVLRKRKAKQLQPEEETQALVTPELSVAETQPMDTGEGEESDEDSVPGPRKRKAKPLQHKDEDTQPLTNSEASAIDSQPIGTKSCEQLQKGKARQSKAGPSGVCDEETHRVVNPFAETQPMCISNYNESNAEDSEGKAKQLLAKKEEAQEVVTHELPADETQPIGANEDVEGGDEDSNSGPRKRKAKLDSEASARNAQNQTKDSLRCQRNEEMQSEAGTSKVSFRNRRGARAREDEEEQAECSEPPKRQTRGKRKTLPTSRGRRGNSRPVDDDDESEEEEEAEQATGVNSKRYEKGEEKRKLKEQERKEREEQERLKLEEERAEKERLVKEKKKQEEKEIADGIQKQKEELLERQRKEKATLDREEKNRKERQQKEHEEKDRLEMARRAEEEQKRLKEERKEQEQQARLEMQEKERLEKQKLKESHENKDAISEAPDRSRRATRRTAAVSSTEAQQESSKAASDDCPARRTRSRSNSSNSVSSERSVSSTNTQESKGRGGGRGKGRGVTRTSELLQKTTARSSNRRTTVATEPSAQREITEGVSNDIPSPGVLSRSYSSNSINSEISSCSVNSQNRRRGGRQRGRGSKTETEPDSVPPISSQRDQQLAPRVTARGKKSRASELPPNQDEITRTDAQQPGTTTRGRRRASVNHSEPPAADEENQSNPEEGSACDPSLLPQGKDRGRKQKTETCETLENPKAPPFSDGHDAEEKRSGRKRDLEMDAEEGSSSKTSRGKRKVQKADEKTEKKAGTTTGHAKKNANESGEEVERKEDGKKVDEKVDEKKARGRHSRVQSKRKEKQEESGMDTDAEVQQPQTPPSTVSRKRQLASLDSSPVAKTPRSSCSSPVTTGRSRAASQGFKVLFTGVVDDAGERVLSRLGGSLAKTVADMNCLVTDKVRRTVKFLCAVAKGVPVVTTQWLEKSGKAGTFQSPSAYVVKDPEQENKFNFCLQESLRIASSQPLLQGYEIHVTKSVKPEPVHMKDIISCSGATFLPKMPSSHKPKTVVVSCEEDWPLCGPAVTASIPVVTAEFILTGILQQKVDFETHKLSGPAATLQPTGGRGRGRKKT